MGKDAPCNNYSKRIKTDHQMEVGVAGSGGQHKGGRRGGGRGRRNGGRGPVREVGIDAYFHPSMLEDPWKDFPETKRTLNRRIGEEGVSSKEGYGDRPWH